MGPTSRQPRKHTLQPENVITRPSKDMARFADVFLAIWGGSSKNVHTSYILKKRAPPISPLYFFGNIMD